MILVADGGSTKTDWRLVGSEHTWSFQTSGLNPFIMSPEQINEVLNQSGLNHHKQHVNQLYYYGAGMANESAKNILRNSFKSWLETDALLDVNDDLLGAARALFHHKKGIACILGTGSNSGYFNGVSIEEKIPALGYILGDEGGGAYIGKQLVNSFLKRDFTQELTQLLNKEGDLTMDKILENVYKKPFPNRYLASLTHIVKKNIHLKEMNKLVANSFEAFLSKNVMKYSNHKDIEIGFVGSVAYHFNDILKEVIAKHQMKPPIVIQSPIDELVKYHLHINK